MNPDAKMFQLLSTKYPQALPMINLTFEERNGEHDMKNHAAGPGEVHGTVSTGKMQMWWDFDSCQQS